MPQGFHVHLDRGCLEMRTITLNLLLLCTHGLADSQSQLLRKPKRGTDNENSSIHLRTKAFLRTAEHDAAIAVNLAPDDAFMEFEELIEGQMSLATSAPTIMGSTSPPMESPSSETMPPTESPDDTPTTLPSEGGLTVLPSESPSMSPSDESASRSPTKVPTIEPTQPTSRPSFVPTNVSSVSPTTAQPSNVPSMAPTDTPSSLPTSRPTVVCNMSPETREELMMTFILIVSAKEAVDDEGSPQNKATRWIINEDGAQLCPQDDAFIQRYVMAVFYYSTNGDRWLQCRSPEDSGLSIPEANDACNITLPGGSGDAWLTPSSECMWGGVSCDSDQDLFVEQIDIESNGLGGTLPFEIRSLQSLTDLSLERGILTGTIPSDIGLLGSLKKLDLDNNLLEGNIPSSLFFLTNLEQLDLDFNDLTGTVSTRIGQLTDLTFLQLNDNSLSGTIPNELSRLTSLQVATLDNNNFSGTMPDEVCLNILEKELTTLTSDCLGAPNRPSPPFVSCTCCTSCF